MTPTIRSRKPTGAVPWPVVLVEGEEKSGKTYLTYLLSASPKVGQMYVLDLGEGSADEYGAIPGVRYEILVHDGTWSQIIEQVAAVRAEARRANDAGEPPVVLAIDTMSDEWEGLKDFASDLARRRKVNRDRLDKDPTAEIIVSNDLWNIVGGRHRRDLMRLLLTFPGIVVMTARGKEVVKIEDGRPVEGQRDYRVEGHKTLAFDASLWLRLSRSAPPVVIGARSVHHGVRPGLDQPKPITEDRPNLLEWLIFDVLQCDPRTAQVRDVRSTTGGELTDEEAGVPPETAARQRIAALADALGIPLPQVAGQFRTAHGQAIGEASLDALTTFEAELQQDAALAREKGEAA